MDDLTLKEAHLEEWSRKAHNVQAGALPGSLAQVQVPANVLLALTAAARKDIRTLTLTVRFFPGLTEGHTLLTISTATGMESAQGICSLEIAGPLLYEDRALITDGIHRAAVGGIDAFEARLRNPVLSTITDWADTVGSAKAKAKAPPITDWAPATRG